MKKLLMALVLTPLIASANTDFVNGIWWRFTISEGEVTVGDDCWNPAVPRETVGAIEIPSTLGGCLVTSSGECAFLGCSGLSVKFGPIQVYNAGRCDY